jgi:tetratricopeptide (TPR) repeat protein
MRVLVLAVIALCCAVLGTVQLGSMMMPKPLGMSIYHALDKIAPLAFVEETLASAALAAGDLDTAEHYARRILPNPRRDDLYGEIALARGQTKLAAEDFFAAADVDRMQTIVADLAKTNPKAALALDLRFGRKLASLETHPDALAETWFNAGVIAASLHRHAESEADYERALHLAPLNMKYVLGAGNEALWGGDYAEAERIYQYGINSVDPASGDVYAGLGLVALHDGDRNRAKAYAARAHALQPDSQMLDALEKALK